MSKPTKLRIKTKFRKGDNVVVISGSSKGKSGKIDSLDCKNNRVFVGGVNVRKRHVKPNQTNPDGGIVEKTLSIHTSNIAIVDPKTSKPSRIGYNLEGGKKTRVSKASKTAL